MGPSAWVRMFRDRFVASHWDCDLWRHFDSVLKMPIRDIVDRCRVWESHVDITKTLPHQTETGEEPVGMLGEQTGSQAGGLGSGGRRYPSVGFGWH